MVNIWTDRESFTTLKTFTSKKKCAGTTWHYRLSSTTGPEMDDLRLELSIFYSITTISYGKLISCWHWSVQMINRHTGALSLISGIEDLLKFQAHHSLLQGIFFKEYIILTIPPVQVYWTQGRLYHRLTARSITTTTTTLYYFLQGDESKRTWYFSRQSRRQIDRFPRQLCHLVQFSVRLSQGGKKEPFATTADCLLERFEMFQKDITSVSYTTEISLWRSMAYFFSQKVKRKPVPISIQRFFTINSCAGVLFFVSY